MDTTATKVCPHHGYCHYSRKNKEKSLLWVTLGVGLFAVRMSSNGCRYKNGGCEHFCREFPDRSYMCFCAPGYRLDQDNSTCLPQGKQHEEKSATEQSEHCWKVTGKKKSEYESVVSVPFQIEANCSLSVHLSGPVAVPCGRPQIYFSPRVINGLVCPKGHCPWQVCVKLMTKIRKTVMWINCTAEISWGLA